MSSGRVARLRHTVLRVFGLARRDAMERRLDEEMRFHIDMHAAESVRRGVPAVEARRRAHVAFGGAERFKDDVRDVHRSHLADSLSRDARYALRVLRRSPGFTAAAVLTFALGIGATAAIFSVVHGVLLRPLPYADPDRLVAVWERNLAHERDRNVASVEALETWRERSRSFTGMAGLVPANITLTRPQGPERIRGAETSPGYFSLLGVRPALGREFTPAEGAGDGAKVVILSDGFWRSHFGADPGVIGQAMVLDGNPYTIIGVMPRTFDPPRFFWLDDQALWLPFAESQLHKQWGRFLLVVARLAPGVTLSAARAELAGIAKQHAAETKGNPVWSATAFGLAEQITGEVRTPLLVLFGAVSLLLAMAIANVANLTLAFTRRRHHELVVRRAIGATTGRLVRQLLTQSIILGAIGCVVGVAVAAAGVKALIALMPADVPRVSSIHLDGAALAFIAGITVLATLVFGSAVAWRAGAAESSASLGAAQGRHAARIGGGTLVTAEIALGLVLTLLAGLMVRSFVALQRVDLGFTTEATLVARVGLEGPRYATPAAKQAFFATLAERVRALPGVQSVGLASSRPFGGAGPATSFRDAARPPVPGVEPPVADVRTTDGAYFRTLRIPVLAGSAFDDADRPDAPPRVVVSQSLARTLWGNENAVGRRIALNMYDGIEPVIIGVVGDVHLFDARTPVRPVAYLADSRFPSEVRDVIVRAEGDPQQVTAALRSAVTALDPSLPIYQVTTLSGLVDRSLARDRFTALLLGAFAVVSLLLAGVGIYGVFSGDVAQRRKEIGIRVALGARPAGVVGLVLRRALVRAAIGITFGVGAALMLARGMRTMLFGVTSTDPTSFLVVTVVLASVAVMATLIPAIRAARVSPLTAIRADS